MFCVQHHMLDSLVGRYGAARYLQCPNAGCDTIEIDVSVQPMSIQLYFQTGNLHLVL